MADESIATLETPTPTVVVPEANLSQQVEIIDVGPCKKHVRVVVDRKAIDERFAEKYNKIARESRTQLDGFNRGRLPNPLSFAVTGPP